MPNEWTRHGKPSSKSYACDNLTMPLTGVLQCLDCGNVYAQMKKARSHETRTGHKNWKPVDDIFGLKRRTP